MATSVSVELAAAWLLQLVASAGGCSLAGCGLLAPTGFGLATNSGAGLLAFGPMVQPLELLGLALGNSALLVHK